MRRPKHFVCIHGHFYQPPRENPWSGAIPLQPSAHPFHDWNERITAECYAPNLAARLLDGAGHVRRTLNLYERISFNFGPTLLSWLERHHPETYAALLAADQAGSWRFGGHGPALAQAYNHVILPLADLHDKRIQVHWGIADFRHRFGRDPEGLWLPETAVDLETLEVLAEAGIRFTLLAPHQARAVRKLGSRRWSPVSAETLDTRRPYLCALPSGRSITLFFYDGPIAQEIAFGGLLRDGEHLLRRLQGRFGRGRDTQLVHVATDGETYGHHHKFGEMALAYALDALEREGGVELTIYGQYLEEHPPAGEVAIHEFTSWSCIHGVERWRSDCGCRISGGQQRWRGPLRDALDGLRDGVRRLAREGLRACGLDPEHALRDYIGVLLADLPQARAEFLRQQSQRVLPAAEATRVFDLLEMARQTQLMYTSCGWFFDDIAGLEATQVLAYAARAAELAGQLSGAPWEEALLARLARAPGNTSVAGSGESVYRSQVAALRQARN